MSPRFSVRRMAAQPDRRLLELAREGQDGAFEAIVKRYRVALLRYCAGMGLSSARAEDVLQQALLQAWIAIGRGAEVRELRPWLYRIVHNTALNSIRGVREEPAALLDSALQRTMPGADSIFEGSLAIRDALGEVAALPEMQRDALLLTALDGRTHEEVARTLGISDGAVRGLLYRARVSLRTAAGALTPTPLLNWVSRSHGRVAAAGARLGEMTAAGGTGEAGKLLLKGAAVAVTAAFAAGAVLAPSHAHRASAKRTGGGAAGAVASVNGVPATLSRYSSRSATASRGLKLAAVSVTPAATPGAIAVTPKPAAILPASGRSAPAQAPTALKPAPAPGATPPAESGKAVIAGASGEASPPASPKAPPSSAPVAEVPPAGGKGGESGGSGTEGKGGEGSKPHEEEGGGTKGSEGEDGGSEQAEREAEQAQERRERESEQAEERREREAEKAEESKEREAEEAEEARERASGDS